MIETTVIKKVTCDGCGSRMRKMKALKRGRFKVGGAGRGEGTTVDLCLKCRRKAVAQFIDGVKKK